MKKYKISFLFLLVFSVALSASAWTGPFEEPPEENTEPPINTSAYPQDKKGDLKIKGTLTADDKFCLGKVCKTSWPSGGDGYIGDWKSKKHIAGSNLDMNDLSIENVKTISAKKFLYTSDRRLKNNIETLDNSLDKITKLRGVNFQWKKDYTKEKQVGLVAQEVEKVYPELVSADSEGMKSVQYGNLIAPLVESVKKLNSKTKEQQKEIEKQNGRIKELEEKIEEILNK